MSNKVQGDFNFLTNTVCSNIREDAGTVSGSWHYDSHQSFSQLSEKTAMTYLIICQV